ncbi:MAG: tRNA (N6-threonylcarbamoyladenosine(37)-N6)-methyltransferase TrmO [Proteobacteria bacterium]|nr:tRNA (N6-threonylcarbamoyladenosine(37)-N6)-methyltransferase TrmO [Pseudomonadota bacterium]
MEEIKYQPIGTIHSPFKEIAGMPIQPAGAKGVTGTIDIDPAYAEGLKDLEGFSHIILVYHFHLSKDFKLQVKPYLDEVSHGVFSTRAPVRPNPIGISIVKLIRIEGCTLHIEEPDMLDGTPLLDIKPYVPAFDVRSADRTGWLSGKAEEARGKKADERFK